VREDSDQAILVGLDKFSERSLIVIPYPQHALHVRISEPSVLINLVSGGGHSRPDSEMK
jgi:hypothetical protein